MRVESTNRELVAALHEMAQVVSTNGGEIASGFTVCEYEGEFRACIEEGESSHILLRYPADLRPQMELIHWRNDQDQLVPFQGTENLSDPQRRLVEAWLTLINKTDKLGQVRRNVPRFAVLHWELRHHLASAGYPGMRKIPTLESLRDTVIGWHSAGTEFSGQPTSSYPEPTTRDEGLGGASFPKSWRLIPLKCFVNHHPQGARQNPFDGDVGVVAAKATCTNETFENYGDLDAMQLLMNFGYLDEVAPLVHSVPVEVSSRLLGRVMVRWRAPRNPREATMAPEAPTLRYTETGLEIRHLTIRNGTRPRVAAFLAMAVKARSGALDNLARIEAETVIDDLLQANAEYYRRLDELVVAAMATPAPAIIEGFGTQDILTTIAAMSMLQQDRLNSMWG